jgi:hypothetical protein
MIGAYGQQRKGGMTLSGYVFSPNIQGVDQAWRLRENNGNGIFSGRVETLLL